MEKTVVLVLLNPEDRDAVPFREGIEGNAQLRERFELRFAPSREAQSVIQEAEVVVCGNISAELLSAAPRLRWISFWSAGLDNKITPEIQARNLLVTNASGVHGPNIAEHVLAWMLMFARRMHLHLRAQLAGEWLRDWNSPRGVVEELSGQTLGIVGLGRIGEALAERAKGLDMRVIAVKRDPLARYEARIKPDALYGLPELPRLLAESDHVCIAAPLTAQTHHLFDAAMLSHMKPTAYLYNIARGKIVDESALAAALQTGKLAGAGLDVFENEPLASDSPLWKLENVLITPHVAGITPHYFQRAAILFMDNLKRYLAGQPLQNLYDPARGY